MGGGHVSRPDFGMAQPDPAHPLTEFYLLVQQALDKAGCFALPALYASLQAPARRIYPEEAREYLRLAPQAGEGFVRLQAAVQMQVLYSSLQVAADSAPAALLLTEECTRSVTALQLLPPFVWEDPLPPLPDVPAALTLQLTVQDVEAIDTDPAAWAAAGGQPGGQVLADPPQGRDLSGRAGGAAAADLPPLTGRKKNEAARELPQTRRLPLLFCRGSWYTKTDTPLRRGEKSFVARL